MFLCFSKSGRLDLKNQVALLSFYFCLAISWLLIYHKFFSVFIFFPLPGVPLLHRTKIAHYPGIDLRFLLHHAFWACPVLAFQVSVRRADAESGCQSKIGQGIIFGNFSDQIFDRRDVPKALSQKTVEDCSSRIFSLQVI